MRKTTTAILTCLALAGCHTGQARVIDLDREGLVRLETVPRDGYDMTVELKGLWHFSVNPDIKAERDAVALEYVQGRCAAPSIIGEDVITTGQSLRGPIRTYLIRVKCRAA